MKSQGVKELIIVNELSQILKFVNIIIALHANVQLVNVIYNVKIQRKMENKRKTISHFNNLAIKQKYKFNKSLFLKDNY